MTTASAPAAVSESSYAQVMPGDAAPWFEQRTAVNPKFHFESVAGCYVVMCFFGRTDDQLGQQAIAAIAANRDCFDDNRALFFGVCTDPRDESEQRVRDSLPGIQYFWDFDGSVSRLYGSIPKESTTIDSASARRFWLVLDPTLRVMTVFPFKAQSCGATDLFNYLRTLPPPHRLLGFDIPPPVLILPNVFEPAMCRRLIDLYRSDGGNESGFMREIDGKTVRVQDASHKRRRDHVIKDPDIINQTRARVIRRIVPEIAKIHYFKVTRMERYIVACYRAEDGGHFAAHRDNATKGTAHRRFAVSINLNDEFEGGELNFPEYGPRTFKLPTGGAVVFTCTMLHKVSKVTSGERYAFLPFLYDDEAAKIRQANNQFLGEGVGSYTNVEAEAAKPA